MRACKEDDCNEAVEGKRKRCAPCAKKRKLSQTLTSCQKQRKIMQEYKEAKEQETKSHITDRDYLGSPYY